MLKLFTYEGYQVNIEPEALLLKPFKVIWDKDKSSDKTMAKQEFAFIYFMEDPRSDYQYLVDREVRKQEIIKGIGLPNKWKVSSDLEKAMQFYSSFKPSSAGLLEDTRFAINKLREMLRNIDLDERDDKGKPVHTLSSITSTIKQIPGLVKDLDEAERTLSKDIMNEAKARGAQSKSLMEDEN